MRSGSDEVCHPEKFKVFPSNLIDFNKGASKAASYNKLKRELVP